MNKENADNFKISHLIFGHSTYNQRADHSRKCADSIRNTHQYAGIPWRNVQVVDIKTLERGRIKKKKKIRNIGKHLFYISECRSIKMGFQNLQ